MEHMSESQVPILAPEEDSSIKLSCSRTTSLSSTTADEKSDSEVPIPTPPAFYLGEDQDENHRNQIYAHLDLAIEEKDIVVKGQNLINKLHCSNPADHPLISPIPTIHCSREPHYNGGCLHPDNVCAVAPHLCKPDSNNASYPLRPAPDHRPSPIILHHTLELPRTDSLNKADDSGPEDALLISKHRLHHQESLRRAAGGTASPGTFSAHSAHGHHHNLHHPHQMQHLPHSNNMSPHSQNSSFGTRRDQGNNKYSIVPRNHRSSREADKSFSKRAGNDGLGLVLSALYGKILVVMGIAFPMSEVISTFIPPSFYDGFYLYLYFGSITFMICILGNMLRQKATRSVRCTIKRMTSKKPSGLPTTVPDITTTEAPTEHSSASSEGSFTESPLSTRIPGKIPRGSHHHHDRLSRVPSENVLDHLGFPIAVADAEIHFGSFYLRMGAVAFGIGSMIYSGLEFGQYFELEPDTKCHNVLIALTPSVRMIFTFMQMYFVFLNSKMAVYKVRLAAQFGLMHMIGTNLCVWLNVLIQETRHEILQFYNPDNNTINVNHGSHLGTHRPRGKVMPHGHDASYGGHGHHGGHLAPATMASIAATAAAAAVPKVHHAAPAVASAVAALAHNVTNFALNATVEASNVLHREKRGLKGPHSIYECRRTDIMGALVQNASPFLFPCTIEYSLICAAILYVMWKSMTVSKAEFIRSHSVYHHGEFHLMGGGVKRSPHYYSVDCARANKGLFLGIFVLVLTIISLILFFVLVTKPDYQALAMLEVNITELVLYTTTTIAVLIGMCQVRELRYDTSRNLELDNILLIVAQTGSFIYNVFTIIGGHFTMRNNTVLVLMTALASLIQLLVQTIFILDASKRTVATADQVRRKPGREVITFLLVTNLAMWAINTLEKSRADSHPVQLKFYGVWAWTIITHISMPLAIFYRFHSTVCLCEIWKRAYKIKHSPNYASLYHNE